VLNYRLRQSTSAIVLHDSHTPPSQSDVQHFLAVGGREKGLLDIGYHFLILRDGLVVTCRPFTVQGTHMRSKRNRDTIAVCLAGGLEPGTCWCEKIGGQPCDQEPTCEAPRPSDNFTSDQWASLTLLLHALRKHYGPLPLLGHYEVDKHHHGRCPPVDMMEVRDRCLTP
jgi:N-acetylmuramoyl-L-alanine amidase